MQSGLVEIQEYSGLGKNAKNQLKDMFERSISHLQAMRKQKWHSDDLLTIISEIP